jgi:hypothetical protein
MMNLHYAVVKIQKWWKTLICDNIIQFCSDIETNEQARHMLDICYCPLCDGGGGAWNLLRALPTLLGILDIDYDYYYKKWKVQREKQFEKDRLWMRTLWRMEWTTDEESELRNQMKNWEDYVMFRQNWEEVADAVGTKNHMECQYHWETLEPGWEDSVGASILKEADDDYFFAEREQTILNFQEGRMIEVIAKCDELIQLTRKYSYREELEELRMNAILTNCSSIGCFI